jgi:HEPN domain-containing protein
MAEALAKAELTTWGICYHAQQSLEKGLKALLVATGADSPRSHNLVRLNAAVDPPGLRSR